MVDLYLIYLVISSFFFDDVSFFGFHLDLEFVFALVLIMYHRMTSPVFWLF